MLVEKFTEGSRIYTFSRILVTAVDVALFPASLSDWPLWAAELCGASELSPFPSLFPSSLNREDFAGATPSATTLYSDYGKMV
jgi:hypothetical protein